MFVFFINPAGRIGPENQRKELFRKNCSMQVCSGVGKVDRSFSLLNLLNDGCHANSVSLINPPSSSLTCVSVPLRGESGSPLGWNVPIPNGPELCIMTHS